MAEPPQDNGIYFQFVNIVIAGVGIAAGAVGVVVKRAWGEGSMAKRVEVLEKLQAETNKELREEIERLISEKQRLAEQVSGFKNDVALKSDVAALGNLIQSHFMSLTSRIDNIRDNMNKNAH